MSECGKHVENLWIVLNDGTGDGGEMGDLEVEIARKLGVVDRLVFGDGGVVFWSVCGGNSLPTSGKNQAPKKLKIPRKNYSF